MENYRKESNNELIPGVLRMIEEDCLPNESTILLGMLGIDYYIKGFDDSLSSKIIQVEQKKRKLQHRNISLMPEQYRILNIIKEKKNNKLLLSCPTSFGKTTLIKEYIYTAKPKFTVYIVPTNALAFELEDDFKETFVDFQIFDAIKNEKNNDLMENKNLIFIGTQEKYKEIEKEIDYKKVDLLVIDEAYKLSEKIKKVDSSRSLMLSEIFLKYINSTKTKFLLLSPTAKHIGFKKYGIKEIATNFSPVTQKFIEVDFNESISYFQEELKQRNKSIFFVDKPKKIGCILKYIDNLEEVNNSFIRRLEDEFDSNWNFIKGLKKGCLIHCGPMPKYIQNKVVTLFNSSNSPYYGLIGTNSISEGINTPTKNIFINPEIEVTDKNIMLLKNTIGRAGRLGVHPIGKVFSSKVNIEVIKKTTPIIELAITNEEQLELVDEEHKDSAIKKLYSSLNIDNLDFLEVLKNSDLSVAEMENFFNYVNIFYSSFCSVSDIVNINCKVFKDYERPYNEITVLLNSAYKKDGEYINLTNFSSKVNRLAELKNIDKSDAVDKLMQVKYSYIPFKCCKVLNFYTSVKEYDIPISDCSKKVFDVFLQKYNNNFIKRTDMDYLNEDEKKVVSRLNEYGINISESEMNTEMIRTLVTSLETRYSMYDIKNAIKRLAIINKRFGDIYIKYFEYNEL